MMFGKRNAVVQRPVRKDSPVAWIENSDVRCVLDDLCKLQKQWEGKIPDYTQLGKGPWASGVLFAIEIARQRIEEDCAGSLIKLNTLLAEWERIASGEEVGTAAAAESISGLDFGIRLVIDRVRGCLDRTPPRKPPMSDDGGKPPSYGSSGKQS